MTAALLSLDSTPIGLQTTKVFSKVLADGSNSAIMLSFGSSFGRRNTMRQLSKN